MNRKVTIIIALQAFLIIVMFWVLVFYGKDEYEAYTHEQAAKIETPNRVSTGLGATVVTLSPEVQVQSDIKTTVLTTSKHQNTLSSFGSVISIDPLIELRTRYLSAKADADVARASLTSSQREYQRLVQLNQDNRNVSDRVVIAAEALFKADQAKVQAAEMQAKNLRDTMRQSWGEVLTVRATEKTSSKSLQQLLEHKEVLLQITLPFDIAEPKADSSLIIAPTGTQSKPVQAMFISASPQTDSAIPGKTYYYRAASNDLRAGMRVTARMSESGANHDGVVVPSSAVVWYGGKAWVYKKQGAEKFTRLPISTETEANNGWFNVGNLKPNDALVTSGAQLLLSEEFKYQIKNENED
jgi:multidrug efflux system membrane fusion protein